MPDIVSNIDHSISRSFQFDYIICDAVFLVIFVTLLVWQKRHAPLVVGVVSGVVFYIIDGVIWNATGVREYEISAAWIKHPVDFMMDFSYGVVAFSWAWIMFENRSKTDIAFWTILVFGGWLVVPVVSSLVHLNDNPISTVRHMESQVGFQLGMVIVGYLLLVVLRYDLGKIVYLFSVGCLLGFMMEFPLVVTGIRPAGVDLIVYETLVLFNQGIPYLYLIYDKLIPALRARIDVTAEIS